LYTKVLYPKKANNRFSFYAGKSKQIIGNREQEKEIIAIIYQEVGSFYLPLNRQKDIHYNF
jgi:hypothetical protein